MKLYVVVGSGNCRKVLATARHLGIQLDIQYLDFFAGDLQQEDFLALNPNGKVPVLQDGDFLLWESDAIMQYLADQTPGNTLLPTSARGRAEVVRWQCWELAHYNEALGVLVWETVIKPKFFNQEPDPVVAARASQFLAGHAAVLEQHLQTRDYVAGDDITLADYSIIQQEAYKDLTPFDWKPFPRLNDYYDRMRQAPHWAATAPPSEEAVGRRPTAA